MVLRVDFDASPIRAGEARPLWAYSEAPIRAVLLCYLTTPPPAGYRACSACGTFSVASGERFEVFADPRVFELPGNFLDVTVSDTTGDAVQFRLQVSVQSRGGAASAAIEV